MPTKVKQANITVPVLKEEKITVVLIGNTGLYLQRMGIKAKQQLLLGGQRKSSSDKLTIKHHPELEFVDSMHLRQGEFAGTQILFPAGAIKSAMATAALVVDGVTKTDVQRLIRIGQAFVPIYGIPSLRMDVCRTAGIGNTPDVRTRAFLEEWATEVTISYFRPAMSAKSVMALLNNAGIMCGIGDFRQEKGKGCYGTWVVEKDGAVPEHLLDVDAQAEAIKECSPYDDETKRLLDAYHQEVANRS